MIGALVDGRYQLVARLGSGGTSSVWRAVDRHDGDRAVAVKILHVARVGSPEALARFDREARTLERLSSPHIVTLRGHGTHDGRPFMVLDLVDGEDLGSRLRRGGPLSPRVAVGIAEQVARGLAVAHAHRIVHRDLKPGNVLLTRSGRVRLVDFGIARMLEEPALTEVGRTVGTGDYMSPEQALGRPVDARSDLYSLGVLLFEMLAGRRPFAGSGCADVAAQHVRALPPSLSAHVPDCPPSLVALVADLLCKDPAGRPADAEALRLRLQTVLTALGDPGDTGQMPAVQVGSGDAPAAGRSAATARASGGGPGRGRPRGDGAPRQAMGRSVRNDSPGGSGRPPAAPPGRQPEDGSAAWERHDALGGPFGDGDEGTDGAAAPSGSRRSRPARRDHDRLRGSSATRRDAGALRWAAVAALVAAVLLGAVVVVRALGDDGSSAAGSTTAATAASTGAVDAEAPAATTARTSTSRPAAGVPLEVSAVSTFDPDSDDGSERDADAPKAVDGNPGTSWQSEIYRTSPEITGFKRGVGLVVELDRPGRVRAVRLSSPVPGYVAGVYTATGEDSPTTLEDWTPAAEPRALDAPRALVRLARRPQARFVMVWVTQLAPTPDADGGYSVTLSEIQPLG